MRNLLIYRERVLQTFLYMEPEQDRGVPLYNGTKSNAFTAPEKRLCEEKVKPAAKPSREELLCPPMSSSD